MDAGIIAARYAKALLKFADETGNGDKVYSQVSALVERMDQVHDFRNYMENHDEIPLERKQSLVEAAVGEPVAMEIKRFLSLVSQRRRMEFFHRMLYSFISLYRKEHAIRTGILTTAFPAEIFKERLEGIVHEKTGAEVCLDMKVDPEIIGGFVLRLDDVLVDASVEGRFKKIRAHLIEKNNRIV